MRQVGHRGELLLFLAVLDVLFGLSLLRAAPEAQQSPTTRFLAEVAPLPWWAGLWVVVAVVCLAGAPVRRDRAAYAAAAALKVLWGSMFLVGWLAGVIDRGWVSAVIWLAFAGIVIRIASWPEPTPEFESARPGT